MNRRRSRLVIRFWLQALLILSLCAPACGAETVGDAEPAPSFAAAREAWLKDHLSDLTRDIMLQEQVLTRRLAAIRAEAERSGTLQGLDLDALLSEDPVHVLTPAERPPASAEAAERLDYWMRRQQEVTTAKLDASWEIRRRQAAAAGPDALLAMFRRDLDRALDSYLADPPALAGALLQDILDLYPYVNLDDVHFFRAEAALVEGAWDTAVDHYLVLLRTQPGSAFRPQAFRHLVYLRSLFGQHATAVAECDEFAADLERASGEVAYLCGREFFLAERYREAQRVLERVGPEDPALTRARHLTGLCLVLERRFDDAIAVFEELLRLKPKGDSAASDRAFQEDARLKLGYLYFEAGRFPEAASMFGAVAKGEARHPEALLGQAWSDLSLADPERALVLARDLVEHYPSSPYRYEAMTLAGYAAENVDRAESQRWYGQVLDEAARSENLRELAVERRQVLQMMRRLVEMEPRVFGEGRSEHFGDYLRLRGETRVLMNRVKYTELQTANTSLREYIEERRQIAQLAGRLKKLLRSGLDAADPREREELALLDREVRRLMDRIRLSGLVEIQRQPLMIHERTLASVNAMLDSLAMGSTLERNRIHGSRAEVDAGKPAGGERARLAGALYRERFRRLESGVEHLRSQATQLKRRPVTSNLPRWSELAFSRMAIGDIDFEELRRIEDRLRELDGYLETIDGLLEGGGGGP